MGKNQTPDERKAIARELASYRRIVEGRCEICGTPFKGTTKRRYCSPRCSMRAYRRRKQEKTAGRSE